MNWFWTGHIAELRGRTIAASCVHGVAGSRTDGYDDGDEEKRAYYREHEGEAVNLLHDRVLEVAEPKEAGDEDSPACSEEEADGVVQVSPAREGSGGVDGSGGHVGLVVKVGHGVLRGRFELSDRRLPMTSLIQAFPALARRWLVQTLSKHYDKINALSRVI